MISEHFLETNIETRPPLFTSPDAPKWRTFARNKNTFNNAAPVVLYPCAGFTIHEEVSLRDYDEFFKLERGKMVWYFPKRENWEE